MFSTLTHFVALAISVMVVIGDIAFIMAHQRFSRNRFITQNINNDNDPTIIPDNAEDESFRFNSWMRGNLDFHKMNVDGRFNVNNEKRINKSVCEEFEQRISELLAVHQQSMWNWNVFPSKDNLRKLNEDEKAIMTFEESWWKRNKLDEYMADESTTILVNEKLKYILSLIRNDMNSKKLAANHKINYLKHLMIENQHSYKFCPFSKPNCIIDSDGIQLIEIDEDADKLDQLNYYWNNIQQQTAHSNKHLYKLTVDAINEEAVKEGFSNAADKFLTSYVEKLNLKDVEELQRLISQSWERIKPFYVKLHAFIRFRLQDVYGWDRVSQHHPITLTLSGTVSAENLKSSFEDVNPFREVGDVHKFLDDVLPQKISQNIDAFKAANELFLKMGFKDMSSFFEVKCGLDDSTETRECYFANSSMMSNPDWKTSCQPFAINMLNQERHDLRVYMCFDNFVWSEFLTAHHLLSHIQDFIQKDHLPMIFRVDPDPVIVEGLSDAFELIVDSPSYLVNNGYIENTAPQIELSMLLKRALTDVAFLPYILSSEYFRWGMLNNSITMDESNLEYWKLRESLQGIVPPFSRTYKDFDAGLLSHITSNLDYLRHYIQIIVRYQIFKSICQIGCASDTSQLPLSQCEISHSNSAKSIGCLIGKVLRRGRSKSWPQRLAMLLKSADSSSHSIDGEGIMNVDVGDLVFNVDPLLEYYNPLINYIDHQISVHNIPIGWDQIFQDEIFQPLDVVKSLFDDEYSATDSESCPFHEKKTKSQETNLRMFSDRFPPFIPIPPSFTEIIREF